MTKFLGLDLGTNSIGWAVVENRISGAELKNKGVHIFSEGVKIEKGNEISKAAERTTFRSARRIKFRRRLRKIETLRVLIENKMCPLTIDELSLWKKDKNKYPVNPEFRKWLSTDEDAGTNPYFFRANAVREKIGHYDLGRVFYHLAQRRGFLSNRLDKGSTEVIDGIRTEFVNQIEFEDQKDELQAWLNLRIENFFNEDTDDKIVKSFVVKFSKLILKIKDKSFDEFKTDLLAFLNRKENLGSVKKGIADLNELIKESGCETLGQYFYEVYKRKGKIRKHYTAREEHYLAEFNKICSVQKLSESLRADLVKSIFYQRKLKSQKGLVGKCSFEKNKSRCPISHPDFEEFRALQFINSIKATDNNNKLQFLTKEEKALIYPKFHRKSKPTFDFSEIAKELTPKGQARFFNYKNNVTVSGCPTISQLSNIFGDDWKSSIYNRYNKKDKKHGLKNIDEVINDIWHVLFTFDKEEKLISFAENNLGLDSKKSIKFSKIILKQEYASLSLNAVHKILPFLREGMIYSYGVFLANIERVIGNDIWNEKENREIIGREIKTLIDNYQETKKREGIVNDLLGNFKSEFNNSHKDYVLDELDKKEINKNILGSYGQKYFESLDTSVQAEIISWIENKYQEQLRKYRGEFIKLKRLDELIADFLITNFNADEKCLSFLYHPSDIETFKVPDRNKEDGKLYLLSPVIPSIKNPMAMRTMHRLRKLINTLIREDIINEETKIHIELARELNDANKRKAIQDYQKNRESERLRYVDEINNLYREQCQKDIEPSEEEILKYQLWEEQEHICLYTGKTINICDFIGADPKFDIEHTIPRSISSDNSQENKTLCDISFNRQVKGNKIPAELHNHKDILLRIEKWKLKISDLENKVQSRKKARGIETKDQKDKRIRQKHYFKLQFEYWNGKYKRFEITDVTKGFKNSQIVDTGIITKYANEYLKSIFEKVYSVKGEMTAEFRKLWGLQEEYKKKERINHVHHCIDAITVACMTKDKYDLLAAAYRADEDNQKQEAREILRKSKPWETFTEDLKKIEEEILVSHYTPDNMRKQSRKKMRVRGKIKRDKSGGPIYQQGDTARGSLHLMTFYGAILRDQSGNATNENVKYENNDSPPNIKYVVRIELDKLSESDVNNIVDPAVKEIILNAINKHGFKLAMKGPIWMNKPKGIEIKKVRCYAPSVKEPLHIKEHRDLSRFNHKREYYAANDQNYCMAIYEGKNSKGQLKREGELINNLEAAQYFKLSNKSHKKQYPIVPDNKNGLPLKTIIRKGQMVILYENNPNEIWDLEESKISERLFEITQLDTEASGIKLLYHQEAREKKDLTAWMGLKTGMKGGKNIGKFKEFPWIKISPNNFDALVEGVDFKVSIAGKIIPINVEAKSLLQ